MFPSSPWRHDTALANLLVSPSRGALSRLCFSPAFCLDAWAANRAQGRETNGQKSFPFQFSAQISLKWRFVRDAFPEPTPMLESGPPIPFAHGALYFSSWLVSQFVIIYVCDYLINVPLFHWTVGSKGANLLCSPVILAPSSCLTCGGYSISIFQINGLLNILQIRWKIKKHF